MNNSSIKLSKLFLILLFCLTYLTAQDMKKVSETDSEEIPQKISVNSGKTIVLMELYSNKPVVEVKINGKGPFKFFLDTGAGGTVLNQDLANELKLPMKGTRKIGDPTDPQGITANRNFVETLEVGGATFSNFIAVSWDNSILYKEGAPRGVLGMPLFTKLLLTVDYPNKKVIIAKGSLPKANGEDVIDYQITEAGLFGVPLKIGMLDTIATLDTGAPSGLSFPSSYVDKLSLEGKPVEVGRGRTVAGEAIIYGAKLRETVKLGQYNFDNPAITFLSRLTHLNIGYRILNQFAITVDQQNRRLKFEKASLTGNNSGQTNSNQIPNDKGKFNEYAGRYGERRLTVENGGLYLQRISGPRGEGPKIKLSEVSKDAFALPETNEIRVKFVRNQNHEISEIQILTPSGDWETSKKEN